MKITYTKIQKTGSWGLRVECAPGEPAPKAGDTVTAVRRDGSSEQCVVGSTYWTGPDRTNPAATVLVVGFSSVRGSLPRASRRARNWRPCGYPGCTPTFCDECDGEGLYGAMRGEGA